jgi:hypothetical protein
MTEMQNAHIVASKGRLTCPTSTIRTVPNGRVGASGPSDTAMSILLSSRLIESSFNTQMMASLTNLGGRVLFVLNTWFPALGNIERFEFLSTSNSLGFIGFLSIIQNAMFISRFRRRVYLYVSPIHLPLQMQGKGIIYTRHAEINSEH